ncbi:MAG TPA: ATP-binding protein [Longimicrobium sp.]|nr:ATP-binding protein [Longimicrobium sp.]
MRFAITKPGFPHDHTITAPGDGMSALTSRRGAPLLIRMVSTNPDVHVRELPPRPDYLLYHLDFGRTLYLADTDDVLYVRFARPMKSRTTAAELIRFLRNYATRDQLVILEISSLSSEIQFERLISPFPNWALARTRELERGLRVNGWETTVAAVLRAGIPRERLNPYQYRGAVTGNRFFGRERQVEALMRRPRLSHLVTGPRMSGKTSLLLEARRRLHDYYSARVPISYIDCRAVVSLPDLIHLILLQIEERSSFARVERWQTPQRWPQFFSYLRGRVGRSADRRLYLFFDEYDAIVEMERRSEFHFTWHLRALHQNNSQERGIIQMVFAGSKRLAASQKNLASGLHNFVNTEECRLDNFDLTTIRHAVERPVQDLGFALEDPPVLAEAILDETGGRPVSVQFVCHEMVRRLIETGREVLTHEIFREIVSGRQYREFYATTLWENCDTLDHFILALGARFPASTAGFTLGDVIAECQRLGMRVHESFVYESFENLENAGFLVSDWRPPDGTSFRFSAPVVREIAAGMDPARIAQRMVFEE